MTLPRPIGPRVEGWTAPPRPPVDLVLKGRHVRLDPLSAEAHAGVLYEAFDAQDWLWDYMPNGPFASSAQYHRWVRSVEGGAEPVFFAITDLNSQSVCGVASYLNIVPQNGSVEVGNIAFAPELQGTIAATEAMFLMMQWAFEAGYRRYEWKCNALNRPSRRAAQRLGFSYEGVFRQHMVVKERNRDTAWFAACDGEWPALKEAFSVWLDPANFDANGQQSERLGDLTGLVRVASDPTL
ncbi:N-acetyltransferase [Pseudooceanicola sediminis]|uniref:N-acetyltransferase n=1 Tax=Pseudooceanicola sediminis TaxID=2211117 RepID=A0A399J3N5_9RHOB|nr:GNAT family protein [Pseudooceanicola sediminis]KAA2314187.1 GNAT family N-acetyltransferase [Puniceibacterium sp. HSS470]RII39954.1 N-acetyltransferase [Pseudooceanicola sediminis]|tara:strand:+ start:7546 stop:8262 length:717 start_codon:yes stop_codon:yes gene_type:complete